MKSVGKIVLFLFMTAALFTLGFSWRDIQNGSLPSSRAFSQLVGSSSSQVRQSPEQVFRQNFYKIQSSYYREVKPKELKYAGMEGLMAALGDPHTLFLVPRAAEDFAIETRANFVGVGARLSPDPLGAKVVVVFEDGPGYRAGLRDGDTVTAVNGQSAVGRTVTEIVDHIRGKEGTNVRLTVTRAGQSKPLTLTVRRERVTTPTVTGNYLKDQQVGYISVASFSEPTPEQFDATLRKLERNQLKGLVIDVRGNPGGLLETAVDLLSRFVEDKIVVTMKDRSGRDQRAMTYSGLTRKWPYPVVILQDEDSASAAEIFSGALKDYRKAMIVGTHSYGKASVQEVRELIDGASAKITVARYFLPVTEDISRKVDEDGQYIQGGVQPDVKVELDPDKDVVFGDPATDLQLKRALELIASKR